MNHSLQIGMPRHHLIGMMVDVSVAVEVRPAFPAGAGFLAQARERGVLRPLVLA